MTVIETIRNKQKSVPVIDAVPLPHRPEMLLIGCVDARLNIEDIGIPYGKAIIYRNIAALVAGIGRRSGDRLSEAAALEFAVNVMKVRDIVVMGHTDCGGIQACLHGAPGDTGHIHKYLEPLEGVRTEVVKRGGNIEAQARAMEEAAVRQSVMNLMSYPAVATAVKAGRLTLHGWVINTASRRISEMNPATGKFAVMV